MEEFLTFVSVTWDKFTSSGTIAIQKIIYILSGYEVSELWALIILLGSSASLLMMLIAFFKRPKKIHYLMEGGHRYYRP